MPKVIFAENRRREYRHRSVSGVLLFVCESSLDVMIGHADAGFSEDKEVLGLMMGSVFCDDEGEYVVVTGTATSKLDASKVSVRFDKESYNQLFASMDSSEGEGVVGWYHSHPGFGCYMSDTDIRTHQGIFGEDAGFAIVIDPAESELAAFSCFGGVPQKIPMIVMEM